MQTRYTRMLLAVTALAAGLGAANTASAVPAHGPNRGVCCRINGADWLAPNARLCRQQHGHILRMGQRCRFGRPGNGSRARRSTSTRGTTHGPKARSSGPQPRSHTTTRGAPLPQARHSRGKPAGHSKPNSLPAGCKPRISATRVGAFTRTGGLASAWAAWEAASRAKYGWKYSYKHAKDRTYGCKRRGALLECKVSGLPCNGSKPNSKPHSKPKPNGKPTNSSGSCKPAISATRVGALTRAGGLTSAWLAWEAASRAKYGWKYKYRKAHNRHESCKRKGLTFNCTVSGNPCK